LIGLLRYPERRRHSGVFFYFINILSDKMRKFVRTPELKNEG